MNHTKSSYNADTETKNNNMCVLLQTNVQAFNRFSQFTLASMHALLAARVNSEVPVFVVNRAVICAMRERERERERELSLIHI